MRSVNSRKKRNPLKVRTLSPLSDYRFRIVFFLLCFGLGGLFFRVGWLQVFQSEHLKSNCSDNFLQASGFALNLIDGAM